ncbi:hypothetical protein M0R45_017605 [Rubus argutus]|uniref:Uncharacterized protein n=1 Tax=Rubus argutus TaxID=59490 RepID=A0AAW1XW82_RUBAR
MTGLYIDLLWDELNEIIYQARTALLGAYISGCNDSLDLQFHGFNDKLPSLLSKFLTKIKSFLPNHDRFKVIKERKERELKNSNMNPQSHGAYLRLQVLHHIAYDVDEGLHVLNGLSISDMKSFIPELWSQVFIEGFCHGNLLEEEAISLSNILKTKFFVQPLPIELRHKNHCICLPPSANLIRDARVKNKSETNSVIELYFQIEPEVGIESTRLRALIRLFNDIVWEPFSDQLRTKEQLGYSVGCYWVITWRVFGFCFNVQSSEYNPIYLQERIDNFINGLEEFLKDDDSFESYRGGLMENLLLKDQSLSEETDRFWHEITNKYMFDINKKVAEEVKSLEKEDVINFYKTYMQQSSPKRRRLAIRVWGCNTDFKEAEARREVEQVIEDLAAFNLSSKYYPSDCF